MQPLDPGDPRVIGPYRLVSRLGSGGMGRVYLGRTAGGRTVAVKVVHAHHAEDEEFRIRFRREVAAARRVGGAWTAPVLDADPDARVPWVATGYVAGPSLAQAVTGVGQTAAPAGPDRAPPLPEHSVHVLGAGLAEALAHVHSLGLVHRDVKPSNVLLTMDGPRLIDFGIARATDGTASLTSKGASIGSPGYMAPEQILGRGVTGAADVFSLGAVLVYAATGRPPFPGDSSAALLYKVVHEEPELDGLTGDLLDVVTRCLAKDPAARPAPEALAHRLAPAGAAGAVAAGWLPATLVEELGRAAVRLLDLDAAAPDAQSAPHAVGVFGPPDPYYARHDTPRPAAPVPAGHLPPADTAPEHRPGKLSLSLAAATGANGRGRRLSCTVALAVAGALAAVTVGSVFLFDLLPGEGKDTAQDGPPAATAPGSGDGSGGGDSGPRGEVPAAYLGTWTGRATASGIPSGSFELTVRQAKSGAEFATLTQTDLIGGTCKDILTLKKAGADEIVATGRGDSSNGPQCSQAAHTIRLRPVGDDLQYTSDDPRAGNPRARLSRTD